MLTCEVKKSLNFLSVLTGGGKLNFTAVCRGKKKKNNEPIPTRYAAPSVKSSSLSFLQYGRKLLQVAQSVWLLS